MKSNRLFLRVGILVVVGAALAIGFVLFLAGSRGGTQILAETVTGESVQGLDVGAPIRYRGVAVGRVTEIGLVAVAYRDQARTATLADRQLVLVRFGIAQSFLAGTASLQEMIDAGLRARITAQGITGVNYVELDFADPERFPAPRLSWEPRQTLVPSIPSTAAQVRTAAETLISRLSDVPLERMATDIADLLHNLNLQTSTGDLAVTLREAAATIAAVRRQAEQTDIAGLVAELRSVATSAQQITGGPELREAVTSISAAAAELRRSTQQLPRTIEVLERTLRTTRGTTSDVQAELIPILNDLRATTASLRATMDNLRTSPSQTLFGAPPQPERRR